MFSEAEGRTGEGMGPDGSRAAKKNGPVLIVALDVPDAAAALKLADQVSALPVWGKVGLELFTAEGPPLVRALAPNNLPVFLDLKVHDIPNTVFLSLLHLLPFPRIG